MAVLADAVIAYEEARDAKRKETYYRKRARERMEHVRLFCEHFGISFETVRAEAKRHGPTQEDEAAD